MLMCFYISCTFVLTRNRQIPWLAIMNINFERKKGDRHDRRHVYGLCMYCTCKRNLGFNWACWVINDDDLISHKIYKQTYFWCVFLFFPVNTTNIENVPFSLDFLVFDKILRKLLTAYSCRVTINTT